MKKPTRPISSPGRTTTITTTTTIEKFPPPLMRFLRSNVGSKSNRGRRSRASPMFIKKKMKNTLIEEPSSPKVTCIGQVRVRRSKKTTTTNHRHRNHRLCGCLKTLKLKFKPKFSILTKWVSFFRCGYCKKSPDLHDSPPETSAGDNGEQEKEEEEEENVTFEAQNKGLISGGPPRNALLLTRCRSAPYRSSSLASKFWESTMEKTEEVVGKFENLSVKEDEEEEEEKEVMNDNGGVNEEGKCDKERNGVGEELKEVKVVPLILSRCKSEPARRTEDQILV